MKFKKIISAATASALVVSAAATAFAHSFSDIEGASYSWAADQIDEMYEAGYITGYEDGTFRPENEITRLECLALFSRAMGAGDDANEEILKIAHTDYDSLISNYSLKWGDDEIAYLLYKGVLKKSDLDTYLLGTAKDEPMKRYESAIIITKALDGEAEATKENAVVLDYTDAKDIPSAAVSYVYYATKAGIMNGMDDGTFSPNTSVKRSQMAVMLSRVVDTTMYSFVNGKLTDFDKDNQTITYTDDEGKEISVEYTDDTKMRITGTLTQASNMISGVAAVFSFSDEDLIAIDTLSSVPDETVSGTFKGYSTSSGTVYISITNSEGTVVSYPCASDVSVTYAGSPATIRSFATGDAIELSLSDGTVTAVRGNEKEIQVKNATVTDMEIGTDVKITISAADEEYDGKTLDVDSKVSVKKNNKDSDLSEIFVGDSVTLTLQYGVVKKIVATSVSKTVEGVIEAITIQSPRSSITVSVKGESVTYTIPADATILINNEEGELYDFRVGDSIKLYTENNAVTKISATTTQTTSGSLTGVVEGVNSSFGFISVKTDDGNITQVFCKDSGTKFVTVDGKDTKLANVEAGQTVSVRGTISNGAFVATLVVIE